MIHKCSTCNFYVAIFTSSTCKRSLAYFKSENKALLCLATISNFIFHFIGTESVSISVLASDIAWLDITGLLL